MTIGLLKNNLTATLARHPGKIDVWVLGNNGLTIITVRAIVSSKAEMLEQKHPFFTNGPTNSPSLPSSSATARPRSFVELAAASALGVINMVFLWPQYGQLTLAAQLGSKSTMTFARTPIFWLSRLGVQWTLFFTAFSFLMCLI